MRPLAYAGTKTDRAAASRGRRGPPASRSSRRQRLPLTAPLRGAAGGWPRLQLRARSAEVRRGAFRISAVTLAALAIFAQTPDNTERKGERFDSFRRSPHSDSGQKVDLSTAPAQGARRRQGLELASLYYG